MKKMRIKIYLHLSLIFIGLCLRLLIKHFHLHYTNALYRTGQQ